MVILPIYVIRRGVITETGPYIPVSLGFSMVEDSDNEWEEVLDGEGRPTGLERRSFRLNILEGRTKSIDDEWAEVRQALGIPDGNNNRRVSEWGENLYETRGRPGGKFLSRE